MFWNFASWMARLLMLTCDTDPVVTFRIPIPMKPITNVVLNIVKRTTTARPSPVLKSSAAVWQFFFSLLSVLHFSAALPVSTLRNQITRKTFEIMQCFWLFSKTGFYKSFRSEKKILEILHSINLSCSIIFCYYRTRRANEDVTWRNHVKDHFIFISA